jgi:hypothetical protein
LTKALTKALTQTLTKALDKAIGGGLIPAEQSEAMAGGQQLQRCLKADAGAASGDQQLPWLPSGGAVPKPLLCGGSFGIGHGVCQPLKTKPGRQSSLPVIKSGGGSESKLAAIGPQWEDIYSKSRGCVWPMTFTISPGKL